MTLSTTLLPELDMEFATTRRFLQAVPFDKKGWQPHEKSMTLEALVFHVVEIADWGATTLTTTELAMTDADMAKDRSLTTSAAMLAKFDADVAAFRAALAKASDADLAVRWKMTWNGAPMIDQPRYEVLRYWVLNHLIHHRAQLGVYFRLLGVAVPGAYGPSADEQQPMG